MTPFEFKALLIRPESSVLDFKSEFYDLNNDPDGNKLAKFIKDVLAFCNTIREQNAFIIFGVKENSDKTKILLGLSSSIDDSILQDKIKDKIYPRPTFCLYTITFEGKQYAILDFPIVKYAFPVTSTVKLKGVEIGKVYYRQGTMNSEALAMDVIRINDWLKSLPTNNNSSSLQEILSQYLNRIMNGTEKLSTILVSLQHVARKHQIPSLLAFTTEELMGFNIDSNSGQREKIRNNEKYYKYRVQTIKVSTINLIGNPSGFSSAEQIKYEVDTNKDFFDFPLFFKFPIAEVENLAHKSDGYAKMKMNVKDVIPNIDKDYPVYGYIFNSTFKSLYQEIKQKLIDLIMKID